MIYTRPQGDTRFRTASSKRYPFMSGEFDNELTLTAADVNKGFPKDVSEPITATFKEKRGSDIASASNVVPGYGNYFDVTGTTSITGIASKGVGTRIVLHFDGVCLITHHATNLILPRGLNILTFAGYEVSFIEHASGQWRMIEASHDLTGRILARQFETTIPVGPNTAVEETIYSYTIPANLLGTNRGVRMVLTMHAYHVAANFIIKLKYGSTTVAIELAMSLSGAGVENFVLEADIFALNAANAQVVRVYRFQNNHGAGTEEQMIASISSHNRRSVDVSCAEDSTTDLDFKFTGEWGSASASNYIELHNAFVELL